MLLVSIDTKLQCLLNLTLIYIWTVSANIHPLKSFVIKKKMFLNDLQAQIDLAILTWVNGVLSEKTAWILVKQ